MNLAIQTSWKNRYLPENWYLLVIYLMVDVNMKSNQ